MVDLEQATTSVEWSYVAAVDSVRHSAGKSYGAPGWEVGEERERRGQGWWPGLGLAVLAGKYELWWPEIMWELIEFWPNRPSLGFLWGLYCPLFCCCETDFGSHLSVSCLPWFSFPQYLFLEIWGWEFIFLMNVFLFQMSTLLSLSASVSSSVKQR